jgi:hypothetical protein
MRATDTMLLEISMESKKKQAGYSSIAVNPIISLT